MLFFCYRYGISKLKLISGVSGIYCLHYRNENFSWNQLFWWDALEQSDSEKPLWFKLPLKHLVLISSSYFFRNPSHLKHGYCWRCLRQRPTSSSILTENGCITCFLKLWGSYLYLQTHRAGELLPNKCCALWGVRVCCASCVNTACVHKTYNPLLGLNGMPMLRVIQALFLPPHPCRCQLQLLKT